MATAEGEYLYIVQEREDVLANRNIFKFGRTSQNPNDRIVHYPKGSRPWMIVIMNDSQKHETILKRMFKKKYIHHKEKGDEYYEPPSVQDMMNDLWEYRTKHFENIFMPEELNCEEYFKNRMVDKLIHDEREDILYFKTSDITRTDFSFYLYSHGWVLDGKRQLIYMTTKNYQHFIQTMNILVDENDINDNVNETNITNNNETQINVNDETNITNETQIDDNGEVGIDNNDETNITNDNGEVGIEKLPLSVEKIADIITKYIQSQKKELSKISVKISTTYDKNNKFVLNIQNIQIFESNLPLIDVDNISSIYPIKPTIDGTRILLSASKFNKFKQVYSEEITNYKVILDSLIKKRFKPKDTSRFLKYIIVRFERN